MISRSSKHSKNFYCLLLSVSSDAENFNWNVFMIAKPVNAKKIFERALQNYGKHLKEPISFWKRRRRTFVLVKKMYIFIKDIFWKIAAHLIILKNAFFELFQAVSSFQLITDLKKKPLMFKSFKAFRASWKQVSSKVILAFHSIVAFNESPNRTRQFSHILQQTSKEFAWSLAQHAWLVRLKLCN